MKHKLSLPKTLIFLIILNIYAQPVLSTEYLFGCLGGASPGAVNAGAEDGGAIILINQNTGKATVLDTPLPGYSLTGLAANSDGRLFAVTNYQPGNSKLIEINPRSGSLIKIIGELTYEGIPESVTDISFQPGTNILFGSSANQNNLNSDDLVTIDISTAVITLIGSPNYTNKSGWVAIAFAPDGTLWAKDANAGNLWKVNPETALVISSTVIDPEIGTIGLTARPGDGTLFLSECCNDVDSNGSVGDDIYTLNTSTGEVKLIGSTGGEHRVHDFAYVDIAGSSTTIPSLNEWGMLILSLLLSIFAICYIKRKVNIQY